MNNTIFVNILIVIISTIICVSTITVYAYHSIRKGVLEELKRRKI